MRATDTPGEFICRRGEPIRIELFCSPSRKAVTIRQISEPGHPAFESDVYRVLMGDAQITVVFEFTFTVTGSCLAQIPNVVNSPSGKFAISAQGSGGRTDVLGFTFNPE